jgi:MFS family permease
MSGILGAALAPFIATWLATKYGVAWVGVYLIVAAILTLIALLLMQETKDISLDKPIADHVGDTVHPG